VAFRALLFSALLVTAPSGLLGQGAPPTLHIQQVMTPQEMQATGVAALTPAQREALDRWLTKYTLRVFKFSKSQSGRAPSVNSSGPYGGVGSGHWIMSNDKDGAIITLEDGSIWQINTVDQVDTSLWLPVTDITVVRARSPIGDYQYELINTEDHEEALARYLGNQ
jgi:hypothetical protein